MLLIRKRRRTTDDILSSLSKLSGELEARRDEIGAEQDDIIRQINDLESRQRVLADEHVRAITASENIRKLTGE